jgi:glyoxylase I family protein
VAVTVVDSRQTMGVETPILPSRLHHHAFVVADQARTRQFYEDVLGMPLVATWCERENLRGKEREYCHTFFSLADGSALAFFQFADAADHAELSASAPQSLNHVALAVDESGQDELIRRLEANDVRYRIVDHGYCRSLYVSDPDGLAVEFTCDAPNVENINARRRADAHAELSRWLGGDRTPNNDLR